MVIHQFFRQLPLQAVVVQVAKLLMVEMVVLEAEAVTVVPIQAVLERQVKEAMALLLEAQMAVVAVVLQALTLQVVLEQMV